MDLGHKGPITTSRPNRGIPFNQGAMGPAASAYIMGT
jgi:hypothetical protein